VIFGWFADWDTGFDIFDILRLFLLYFDCANTVLAKHCLSYRSFLNKMSSIPPAWNLVIMPVAALITSIQQDITGATPVLENMAVEGLGIQLDFKLEQDPMDISSWGTRWVF
jgi:hypothetical protein